MSSYGVNFQGRYVMVHPWTGPIACEHPYRGSWGGPPSGPSPTLSATNTALTSGIPAARSVPELLVDSVPALGITASGVLPAPAPAAAPAAVSGCGSCSIRRSSSGLMGVALAAWAITISLRRRRR